MGVADEDWVHGIWEGRPPPLINTFFLLKTAALFIYSMATMTGK